VKNRHIYNSEGKHQLVSSGELIHAVAMRLTRCGRLNLVVSLLAPALLFAIAAAAFFGDILSPYLPISLFVGSFLLGFIFVRPSYVRFRRISTTEAARRIDSATNAQDRFLTLVTVPDEKRSAMKDSLDAISIQSEEFASTFSLQQEIPLRLEKTARYSAFSSPLLFVALLLTLFLGSAGASRLSPAIAALSEEQARELRELAAQVRDLPEDLRDELLRLAETLENEGILAEEFLEQLDKTIDDFEDLSLEDLKERSIPEDKDFKEEAKKRDDREPDERDKPTPEERELPAEEQQEEGEKSPSESGNRDESGRESGESKDEQGEAGETENSDESQADGKKGKKQNDKKSGGESDSGTSDEDSKKAKAGVGDGKGEGENSKDTTGGKKQAGSDDTNAKEGSAENERQSDSGETGDEQRQGEEEQQGSDQSDSDSQSTSGDKGKNEGKKGGGSDKQDGSDRESGEEGSTSGSNKIEQVKEKLNELKKKSEAVSENEDKDQQGSGKKNREGQKEEDKRSGSEGKAGKEMSRGDKAPKGDTQEDDSGSKRKISEPSKTRSGNTPKIRNEKKKGGPTTESNEISGGKDKNPEGTPRPSEKGKRSGPFGGGNNGELLSGTEEITTVSVKGNEKISLGELGAEDSKLYKNRPGASAKTKLSDEEFKKPEADTANENQPIPVEYWDLLR